MKRVLDIVPIALLAAAVALNVYQMRQIRALRQTLVSMGSTPLGAQRTRGDNAPTFDVRDLDGNPVAIDHSVGVRRIIYVFTPECVWCKANVPNLRTLIDDARGRYDIVGISISNIGVREYLEANKLALKTYVEPTYQTRVNWNLASTPMTILVSGDGKVEGIWMGAYRATVQAELEQILELKLPGVLSVQ